MVVHDLATKNLSWKKKSKIVRDFVWDGHLSFRGISPLRPPMVEKISLVSPATRKEHTYHCSILPLVCSNCTNCFNMAGHVMVVHDFHPNQKNLLVLLLFF